MECNHLRRPTIWLDDEKMDEDRKSTRLNSSHLGISYAVFCLKKEKNTSELQSLRHLVCRLLLAKKKLYTSVETLSDAQVQPTAAHYTADSSTARSYMQTIEHI